MAPDTTPLGGVDTLVVMAARPEYGPALAARVTPLFTGVGPVEAAIATTHALATLAQAGRLPRLVLSIGSAGSARLDHLGVYQASSVAWRDIDASPLGFARGTVPFLDLPAHLPLAPLVPGLNQATLSTGGDIVHGPAYDKIAEDMVDMETYAIQRACMGFGLPLIALRGISDGSAPLGKLTDWTDALPILDRHLAEALDHTARELANGLLA